MTLKTVKALKITHCRYHTSKKQGKKIFRLNIALLVVTDVGCEGEWEGQGQSLIMEMILASRINMKRLKNCQFSRN